MCLFYFVPNIKIIISWNVCILTAQAPSPPPIPSIPVAPLKSWRPIPVVEPSLKVAAPVQEPMMRKPWEPVAAPEKPEPSPWQQWTPPTVEQLQKREAPHLRTEPKFVVPRTEKILESNLQYRRSKEPEQRQAPRPVEVSRSRS